MAGAHLITTSIFAIIACCIASFNSHRKLEDYDSNGCCLSCGEFYCRSSGKCITDWGSCDLGVSDPKTCSFVYNASAEGFQFSYDLGKYQSKTGFYKITDSFTHPDLEFEYYFSLCQSSTFANAHVPMECERTSGEGEEKCNKNSLAYQYCSTGFPGYRSEKCFRLSSCFKIKGSPEIELGLLDPVNPTSGIYVKCVCTMLTLSTPPPILNSCIARYSGGNTCKNSFSDKEECDVKTYQDEDYCARSFTLNVQCHNEIDEIPAIEKVTEGEGCQYAATINHKMGCPVECPRDSDDRVCGARGVCFYAGYDGGEAVDDPEGPQVPPPPPPPILFTPVYVLLHFPICKQYCQHP